MSSNEQIGYWQGVEVEMCFIQGKNAYFGAGSNSRPLTSWPLSFWSKIFKFLFG
jgi:hypothetical protein